MGLHGLDDQDFFEATDLIERVFAELGKAVLSKKNAVFLESNELIHYALSTLVEIQELLQNAREIHNCISETEHDEAMMNSE